VRSATWMRGQRLPVAGALPAGQGLDADQVAVGQAPQGLIVQGELAPFQGARHLGRQTVPSTFLLGPGGVEQRRTPLVLPRPAQGEPGVVQPAVGVGPPDRAFHQPGERRHVQRVAVDRERAGQQAQRLIGHLDQVVGAGGGGDQDGEQVVGRMGEDAQRTQPAGDRGQQPGTLVVAENVGELVVAVEAEQQQADAAAGQLGQALAQVLLVGQARIGAVQHGLLQLALQVELDAPPVDLLGAVDVFGGTDGGVALGGDEPGGQAVEQGQDAGPGLGVVADGGGQAAGQQVHGRADHRRGGHAQVDQFGADAVTGGGVERLGPDRGDELLEQVVQGSAGTGPDAGHEARLGHAAQPVVGEFREIRHASRLRAMATSAVGCDGSPASSGSGRQSVARTTPGSTSSNSSPISAATCSAVRITTGVGVFS